MYPSVALDLTIASSYSPAPAVGRGYRARKQMCERQVVESRCRQLLSSLRFLCSFEPELLAAGQGGAMAHLFKPEEVRHG